MFKHSNSEWGVIRSAMELNCPDIFKFFTGNLYGVMVKTTGRTLVVSYFTTQPNMQIVPADQQQVSDTVIYRPGELDPVLITGCAGTIGVTSTLVVQNIFGDATTRLLADKYLKSNISLG